MVLEREGFLAFDEAPSLCDLPATTDGQECRNTPTIDEDRTTKDQDLFEFFHDFSSDMCAADDIFFCGKLLPHSTPALHSTTIEGDRKWPLTFHHMQLESPDVLINGPGHAKNQAASRRFSVDDYQRLEQFSSSSTAPSTPTHVQISRRVVYSGDKCYGDGDDASSPLKVSRPKWYALMFGSVTVPPIKMEMNDIRSRLRRRRCPPGSMAACSGRQTAVSFSGELGFGGKRCWKLLRALSCQCQGHANAVITPTLGLHAARVRAV